MNVFITGASRGIGLELTRNALVKGETVMAVARDPEGSSGLQELKKTFATNLTTLKVDLIEPEAMAKIGAALTDWSGIDVLINNAGIYPKGEKVEDFVEGYRVNSVMPFLVTRSLLGKLRTGKDPRCVQITSLMGSIEDNSSGRQLCLPRVQDCT